MTWSVDVDATSPEAAAEIAEVLMFDPNRLGNIFEVSTEGGATTFVEVMPDGVARSFSPDDAAQPPSDPSS